MHSLFAKPNQDEASLFIYLEHEFDLHAPFFNVILIDADSIGPEELIFTAFQKRFPLAFEEEPQIPCNKKTAAVDSNVNGIFSISPDI